MDQHDKRKMETELMVMGLKGLSDPELIQQLANLVSGWPGDRNQFFIDLLKECDAPRRYEMYQAMAPKLAFLPLSYIECETVIASIASSQVSHGRMRVEGEAPKPIEIGGMKFVETSAATATAAIARLKCHKCGRKAQFLGETPVAAMIGARKAGWVRDVVRDKELCPECPDTVHRAPLMERGIA